MINDAKRNARMPHYTQPEEFGTTGLQEWVNNASDLAYFKQRRDRAEEIIRSRCGSFGAQVFVERLCDSRPAARRQLALQQEDWKRHTELALHWAHFIKDALIAGKPNPIKVIPEHQHTLELAFDVATGQCPFLKI